MLHGKPPKGPISSKKVVGVSAEPDIFSAKHYWQKRAVAGTGFRACRSKSGLSEEFHKLLTVRDIVVLDSRSDGMTIVEGGIHGTRSRS
jgi:hypothetical protein